MEYVINRKILSIPPYISTGWDNVTSLYIENQSAQDILVIELKTGSTIKIPRLDSSILAKVFQTHTRYLEEAEKPAKSSMKTGFIPPYNFDHLSTLGIPMKFGVNLEGLGAAMQHDPNQANAPDLPKEVLEKISAVAKIMDTDTMLNGALKAEPHCNCMHCQIARALHQDPTPSSDPIEEEVSDEDLKFKSWDIEQTGDKLYCVSNPLDKKEHYNVFLGEPLGCTCGQKNCEHLKAVLNS